MKKIVILAIFICSLILPIALAVQDAFLIEHWNFTDTGDGAKGNIDLTLVNSPVYVNTPLGKGIQLDGVNQYLRNSDVGVGNYFENLGNFTVVTIMYLSSSTANRAHFSAGNNDNAGSDTIELNTRTTDNAQMFVQNQSAFFAYDSNQVAQPEGSWMCRADVWDGTYGIVYMNDSSSTSNLVTVEYEEGFLGQTRTTINDVVTVGALKRTTNAEQYFDGIIDEMWVYNSTLSNSTIAELCFNTTPATGLDNCTVFNTLSLKYTILDESNLSLLNATVEGTYNYSFDSINYRQYELSSINEENYGICISLADTQISTNYFLTFSANNYPERRFTILGDDINSNVSNINLYLLHQNDGIYARLRTVDQYGNVIPSVFATMKNSALETVESSTTDSAGLVTFFADPNQDYTLTFQKLGYQTQSITIRPTSAEIYTVTMSILEFTLNKSISSGISYGFSPKNTLLQNNTAYNFQFNMTSDIWEITSCFLYLKYLNGTILNSSNSSFTGTTCDIQINRNAENINYIVSQGVWVLNSSITDNASVSYFVGTSQPGNFTLKTFLDDISEFSGYGFDNFTRAIIGLFAVIILAFGASQFTGFTRKTEVILVVLTAIWIVSYLGWFNLVDGNILSAHFQKYIIFYVSSFMGTAFILQEIQA